MSGKILKFLLVVFFVYACVVQLNDVDAAVWIAMYAIAAVMTLLSVFYIYPPIVPGVFALVSLGWSLVLFPDTLAQNFSMDKEVPREFMGLVIVGLVMAGLSFFHRRARVTNPNLKSP